MDSDSGVSTKSIISEDLEKLKNNFDREIDNIFNDDQDNGLWSKTIAELQREKEKLEPLVKELRKARAKQSKEELTGTSQIESN